MAQGASGIMSVTGEPGRPPVKAGIPLTDLGAGLFAVSGILGALHHRHASGRGQHVDTSLFEAGVALSVWEATEYFSSGAVPQPFGSAHRLNAPYQAIRCADGYITIGAANDRLFARLAEGVGELFVLGDGLAQLPLGLEQPLFESADPLGRVLQTLAQLDDLFFERGELLAKGLRLGFECVAR